MILHDPYQFKLLELQRDPRIVEHINGYIVTEYGYLKDTQPLKIKDFVTATGVLKPVMLYGGTHIEKDIPAFHHPLANTKNNWLALDLRSLVRVPAEGGAAVPRNASDYALTVTRFILTGLWMVDKQSSLYALRLPHLAFAEWLSTNLTRKFGLNITDQIKLFVLAALYYSHLFTNDFGEDDVAKLKLRLQGEIFVESLVDEVAANAGSLNNADEFCSACFIVTQSPRLQGLTLGVLMNVLVNNWFSTQGADLPMLSLEHPPTWISMVGACVTSKSYRNSYISKVVDSKNKRGSGDEFLKDLNALIRSHTGE